jgi:hypothetical protein
VKTLELPGRLRVSQSLWRDWTKCRYKFKLVHVDRLTRRRSARPLQIGVLVHVGLEAAVRLYSDYEPGPGLDHPPSLESYRAAILSAILAKTGEMTAAVSEMGNPGDEWLEETDQNAGMAAVITMRAVEWLGLHLATCEWETVRLPDGTPCIELEMLADYVTHDIGGKLDWLVRHRGTGDVWLVDFKTRDNIQPPEFDARQVQGPLYLWLLKSVHGLDVRGTATIQVRRRVPERPRLNKTKRKGEARPGMSRSSITTDWDTYCAALVEEGLDPNDYLDMKEKMRPFFAISYEPRSAREVYITAKEAMMLATDILTTPATLIYRARSPMNCIGCDMEPLCTADLHGHDVEFLKRTEYTDADEPVMYFEYTEEEDDNAALSD